MKLNKIALAMITASAATVAANAGVTITPLVGYHHTEFNDTEETQREVLITGKDLVDPEGETTQGISKESGLYTGLALGVDLSNATQFQVEYGVSDADGKASKESAEDSANLFDVEQQMISGNFLVGLNQFVDTGWAVDPYLLVGAGQSKIKVENQETYDDVNAGTEVSESKDTIGNLGLGALYNINNNVALRGEARAIHNFDNDWWEGLATAGLQVALGRAAPAVAAPVAPVVMDKDSDKDGVIDRLDACPGTPMNVVVDAKGCPVQEDIVDALKMELRVFFDNDKANIKQQYKPEIAKVAEKMREYPNSVAKIEGHASKTGPSAAYNQRLSEARAVAVKAMLANEFGVNPARVATKGYGYERPIASNDNEEGRAMNRRVYAIITGDKSVTKTKTK